ncbi:hypothetical protein PROFUN_11349 [Planoprotostelium fungivorum]|uniref:Uncharacterized protein n=1 Tax=Planoprotostelium fungivorum TaxID=1890364 RepID=A0A2P6NAC3_9EUKA|nr:hypothetical protein PROFUN_11349 [Planoprotostelium fungivorum]
MEVLFLKPNPLPHQVADRYIQFEHEPVPLFTNEATVYITPHSYILENGTIDTTHAREPIALEKGGRKGLRLPKMETLAHQFNLRGEVSKREWALTISGPTLPDSREARKVKYSDRKSITPKKLKTDPIPDNTPLYSPHTQLRDLQDRLYAEMSTNSDTATTERLVKTILDLLPVVTEKHNFIPPVHLRWNGTTLYNDREPLVSLQEDYGIIIQPPARRTLNGIITVSSKFSSTRLEGLEVQRVHARPPEDTGVVKMSIYRLSQSIHMREYWACWLVQWSKTAHSDLPQNASATSSDDDEEGTSVSAALLALGDAVDFLQRGTKPPTVVNGPPSPLLDDLMAHATSLTNMSNPASSHPNQPHTSPSPTIIATPSIINSIVPATSPPKTLNAHTTPPPTIRDVVLKTEETLPEEDVDRREEKREEEREDKREEEEKEGEHREEKEVDEREEKEEEKGEEREGGKKRKMILEWDGEWTEETMREELGRIARDHMPQKGDKDEPIMNLLVQGKVTQVFF